jgi:Flp pilus assembly protein TadG
MRLACLLRTNAARHTFTSPSHLDKTFMINGHRKRSLLQNPSRAKTSAAGWLRRGVATAELAVCLPIVVLLVLATIEACSMIFLKQALTVASYEGVRTALVKGATSKDVQTACEQVLTDRRIEGASVAITPADLSALGPGDFVDVTVDAPCATNSVLPVTFYRGQSLSTTASMMIEF